jgi:hypothetical protein
MRISSNRVVISLSWAAAVWGARGGIAWGDLSGPWWVCGVLQQG